MTYEALRERYRAMTYDSYEYDVQPDGLHIAFSFHIGPDIAFHPHAVVESRPFLRFDQPKEVMDTIVFNIGMAELVSYWKCACPPLVEVRCGTLDDRQAAFWRKLYWHGEGEFFYVNHIEAREDDFMTLRSAPLARRHSPAATPAATPGYLVPIGGGKDSVVTLEALKGAGHEVTPLIMNPRGATLRCAQRAGFGRESVIVINRSIDPTLLQLNKQGYLNGHTPFSAMLATYTLLAAQLSGRHAIALSNESSANESTVACSDVNHQYSKSLEFEDDFRRHVAACVGPYRYFSFLRPLSELQIALLFSRLGQYHDVFRSCNVGSKQDVWCGRCAKCLFAYIILSPFMPPPALRDIFGKDMLDDESLRPLFDQLTGRMPVKPFECVGTRDEVNSALSMAIERHYPARRPALLRDYQPTAPTVPLHTLCANHNLTPQEADILARLLADALA